MDEISLLMQASSGESGLTALHFMKKHFNQREERNGSPKYQTLMVELCKLKRSIFIINEVSIWVSMGLFRSNAKYEQIGATNTSILR